MLSDITFRQRGIELDHDLAVISASQAHHKEIVTPDKARTDGKDDSVERDQNDRCSSCFSERE